MAAITSAMVKELRERTSAGMMDCKKALVESDGDMEKAIEWLREKGLSQAAKKASRIAAEGVVAQYVSEDGKIGAIVEVNCETDFVAKTDNFIGFANKVAKQVALANPADVDAMLAQPSVDDNSKTISDLVSDATVAIGEKISIRRTAQLRFTAVGREEIRYSPFCSIAARKASISSPSACSDSTYMPYPAQIPMAGAPRTARVLMAS